MELQTDIECWISLLHLENRRDSSELTFVAPSNISDAGNGLFAASDIEDGTVIGRYTGKVYRTREAIRLKDKRYLMRLGEQCYIDAKDCLNVTCRYINDIRNTSFYNVQFIKLPLDECALVSTTKRIRKGEEIYVDYGKWYWLGHDFNHH